MRDHVGDAQQVCAAQLVGKRIDRALPERVVRAGQVDQVRVVRDRVFDHELSQRAAKSLDVVGCDRLRPPLVVVLGEELDAIAAAAMGNLDGLVVAAGHRHMSAKNGHRRAPSKMDRLFHRLAIR